MAIQVVILAAGQGTRMQSNLPKVLHPLAGKSLLEHVISTAAKLDPAVSPMVICGHQSQLLREALSKYPISWVEQKEQLGTGHALQQALPLIKGDRVLVLYGDVPLISETTLKRLIDTTPANAIGMLTAELQNPAGYGRIKRDLEENIIGIVEEKDATEQERTIQEVNPGIYVIPMQLLNKWLPSLKNNNAQKEYYLTDVISFAVNENITIHDVQPTSIEEIFGINDRVQLSRLERHYQQEQAEKYMRQGVTIIDPKRFDVRGEAIIGRDVTIDVNVILEGKVSIGDGCIIGANSILRDTQLGERVEVKAHTLIEGATIAADCIIGPFARIRPGTVLAAQAHIGNFVEIKQSSIGEKSKINHLSYVGDSVIGKRVNVGAGTITCNYDGAHKHKTTIGDDVHIGSDTQLVAPVTVGEGATIAAGSTVTKDVSPHELTLTHHLEQRTKAGWKRPVK
jgi:bifunctional UDP-N-acetylglucosamine pyrophosphorylase/glucosamine-1-phosphate N-acetyltransferase